MSTHDATSSLHRSTRSCWQPRISREKDAAADKTRIFPQIRQLALVELRKRVSAKKHKQWLAQPQEVRAALKARLLDFLLSETKCVFYCESCARHKY